eukprot:Selendium_serpulae@DN2074_c0_g1_i2.p1
MGGMCMENCDMCASSTTMYCDGCNCVECLYPSHCDVTTGQICTSGTCGTSCMTDVDCGGGRCYSGMCRECLEDADCPHGLACASNICGQQSQSGGSMDHDMSMYFTATTEVIVLFKGWATQNTWQYVLTCFACFAMGMLAVEAKTQRIGVEKKLVDKTHPSPYFWHHIANNSIRGAMAFCVYTIDYLLMLIIMTFNVGIFFSVIAGVATMFLFRGQAMYN